MGQKILVAFDESENAMRAVEFIIKSFAPQNSITLFSVLQNTAALCEMNSPELTPYFLSQQQNFCILEDQKRKLLEEAQQKAKARLVEAGFDAARINLKIQDRQKGIARDICGEANSGYDIIVLGRRGLSRIEELLLGSVSHKVLQLAKDVSILIVN
jgi:nucleotide-binding universal stress UspA family protein